ncbi:AfsR/SARP family transcriptional regulator [Streptomyces litchfieldiae]|uniref:Tetratricopeptide repeat protein n=1 Tax=Streptomyces litchfieldiae TaxID=3075543 RepID=A0ABU2MQS5_9ACTN|nr:tetratricopeptide repeat protein [Streptomyces sp. DSM 44938]MDT0342954.1 tetratricopeptide repeat protein [Streptomyces sp. DSM 44938]
MFRVLGPLDVSHEGQRCELTSARQRAVLAVLLCAEGRPVSVEELVDKVWNGTPPPEAVNSLRSHVSRLRKRLRGVVGGWADIERPGPGQYHLRVDAPEAVDFLRFRHLRGRARAAVADGQEKRAVELFREAEALFRGEPLAGFTADWACAQRERLTEELRGMRVERIRLELDLGRHADLTGELRELVATDLLAENFVELLMLALHRSGRASAALAAYRALRQRLAEETGQPPGAALERLHQRMLAEDPSLLLPADPGRPVGAPCTLPRDTPDFTGREAELRELLTLGDGAQPVSPVTVVHGLGGMGKTALAVRAAHALRDRFPHGVYFVQLRAHDQQPRSPMDLLATLAMDAGIPLTQVPRDLSDWMSVWRSWTADRSLLLVLDDARDAEQVRPLIPASPASGAIVTSRRRLARLEGARFVSLGALSESEAAGLFARIAGDERPLDPGDLSRVVGLCHRQPMMLRLTASRFRHRDAWTLTDLADQLADSGEPLGEDGANAGVFSLSYRELGEPARRLFRRLALHPGPDLDRLAVGALMAEERGISAAIEELLDWHLLTERLRGRYSFHDLVRGFAQRLGREEDTAATRATATRRLLSHYLTRAEEADRIRHPARRRLEVGPECRYGDSGGFRGADDAADWLDREKSNLLAVARLAVEVSPDHAALFPHFLARAFLTWGARHIGAELFSAAIAVLTARGDSSAVARNLVERATILCEENHSEAARSAWRAVPIAIRNGDRHTEADAHVQLARAQLAAGRHDRTHEYLNRALPLYRLVGDRHGEAEVLNLRAVSLGYAGDLDGAFRQCREVLALQRRIGNAHGEMRALNNLSEACYLAKRYDEALGYLVEARVLAERVGSRREVANVHNNMANVYRATGRTAEAFTYYRRALEGYSSDRQEALSTADAHINIGRALQESGQAAEALTHFTTALDIARRIGNGFETQRALLGIAAWQQAAGRYGAALDAYQEALEIAERINVTDGRARALDGVHQVLLRIRGADAARDHGLRALDLYRRLGATEEAAAVERRLAGPAVDVS